MDEQKKENLNPDTAPEAEAPCPEQPPVSQDTDDTIRFEDIPLAGSDTPLEQDDTVVIGNIPAQEAEEVPEHTESEEASEPAEEPAEEPGDDTVRIGDLSELNKESALEGDTVRLDQIADVPDRQEQAALEGDTVRLDTLDIPKEEGVEPFSENWEPDYDEPMGEYVPPAPIIFRAKSRLHELKRQLVSGPEKRYYDLSEQGTVKLQLAIFLSLLVVLFSAGGTVLYAMGMVQEHRMRLMIFSQIFFMLLSGLLGCFQMLDGILELLKGKFTLNTLLFLTFAACCVDGVYCLKELRVPTCAAFSLTMLLSLLRVYHKRSTEMAMMDTMRKATRLDGLVKVPEYYENLPGILRTEGRVEDFMESYDLPSSPEKHLNRYALAAFLLSVGISVAAGVFHGVSMGVQILATTLLVSVPASSFIALSRPMAILEHRLHAVGTVLCGWAGVSGLCGKAAFPLTDSDIFPAGSAKMNGVKFYGDRDPDEIIAYTAALIRANGDGLAPIFEQLVESRNAIRYTADKMQYYPNGGIGGEVAEEPVLVGTLSFLQEMGVEIPDGTMVNQAVYIAIDGTLCGVYAISYNRMKSAVAGLTTISSYRKLTPVMVSGDFMLTESFLKSKFGISTKRLAFPPRPVRQELAAITADPEMKALAMTTQEGLASAAYAVTGARALRSACRLGLAVHMFGGILGLVMMLLLGILGSVELLTPINVLLYQLVWLVPGLLFTEWTRAI